MPLYSYKARDGAGRPVSAVMEAASKDELVSKLKTMGYMATMVKESSPAKKFSSIMERFQPVGTEDMVIFNVELANMIGSGVSLLDSLRILSRQFENARLRAALGRVLESIIAGETFSGALALHPRVFSRFLVNMVRAGESSGNLALVLQRVADYYEAQALLKQRIKEIILYPLIVLALAGGVTFFLVTFVIPRFVEIFKTMNITLPLSTVILYDIGIGVKRFWYVGLLALALAAAGLRSYILSEKGGYLYDRVKLKLPVVGPVYRRVILSRFSATLSTLMGSGVPILEALRITRDVMGNAVYERCLDRVHDSVKKGEGIAASLEETGEFPPVLVQMVAVGEGSGNLREMLIKVCDLNDKAIAYAIKKFTTIIEPLILVVVGGIVAFIMISMLLPIFNMTRAFVR